MNYSQWLKLTDEERRRVVQSWNPFEGDGVDLLEEAILRFRREHAEALREWEVRGALYHGSVLGISVTYKRGARPRRPTGSFGGFPVFWGQERARRRSGPPIKTSAGPATTGGSARNHGHRPPLPSVLGNKRALRRRRTGSAG